MADNDYTKDLERQLRETRTAAHKVADMYAAAQAVNAELLAACKELDAVMTLMNESAQYEQLWYQLPPRLLEAGRMAYKAIARAEGR